MSTNNSNIFEFYVYNPRRIESTKILKLLLKNVFYINYLHDKKVNFNISHISHSSFGVGRPNFEIVDRVNESMPYASTIESD